MNEDRLSQGGDTRDLDTHNPLPLPAEQDERLPGSEIIELLEEHVQVERRKLLGQTVRVATETRMREQLVEELLQRETVEVERVAVGQVVASAPAVREEGEFIIVPIMEEVLVVERRLVLKEEVRIRRVRTTETHRETVQLREQTATITRKQPGSAPVSDTPQSV